MTFGKKFLTEKEYKEISNLYKDGRQLRFYHRNKD